MGSTPVEIIILALLTGVASVVPVVGVYWLIRLAVRHGVMDARSRVPDESRTDA